MGEQWQLNHNKSKEFARQQRAIARRGFPRDIDDQTRMRIKLMVKSELERSLASDGSNDREAGGSRPRRDRILNWTAPVQIRDIVSGIS